MDEMILIGTSYGRFKTQRGDMMDYCNVYCLFPFRGTEGPDYHFAGQKAAKFRCVRPSVFEGIEVGTLCAFSFDSHGTVIRIEPVS